MVDRRTQHCNSRSWKVWALTQGFDEHHDQLYGADDAVVLDDFADVEAIVECESAVQVYAKVTYSRQIDIDADSSRLKTL